jgi:phage tail-like protein
MPEAARPPAPAAAAAAAGATSEPFRAYHFKLEVEGVIAAHFTQCSGLAVRVNTIAYRAGGEGQVVHQLPGPVDYAPLVCRYGVTDSADLWKWMQASMRGHVARKHLSVLYLDSDGVTELKRYNLYEAWPCEWHAAPLDSLDRQVAIETLAITYESIDRA